MRKTIMLMAILAMFGTAFAQKKTTKKVDQNSSEEKIKFKTKIDTISYILGADIGKNLKQNSIDITPSFFYKGMMDALSKADTLFNKEQIDSIMRAFQQEVVARMDAEKAKASGETKAKGATFLEENKKKEGVITTASGLQYKILEPGTGESPKATDEVTVHYTGTLIDGTVFDSSRESEKPATFVLANVIPGWTEGLQLIKTGGKMMLYIPSELAYGDREVGPIPAGSVLIFEVELISFTKK